MKSVRFYQVYYVHEDDRWGVTGSLWRAVAAECAARAVADRIIGSGQRSYYGEFRRARTDYLYFGKIRGHHEFDQFHQSVGVGGPSTGPGELSERTVVVPFGAYGAVAVLAPTGAPVGATVIGRWLTELLRPSNNAPIGFVAGMPSCTATQIGLPEDIPYDGYLALVPVVDPRLEAKLEEATGASLLTVRLPGDLTEDQRKQLGQIASAYEAARGLVHEGTVEITISTGRRSSRGLLNAIRRVRKSGAAFDKAKVKIDVPGTDGSRREMHDLVADRVVIRVDVDDRGQGEGADGAVDAGLVAIEQFRMRVG